MLAHQQKNDSTPTAGTAGTWVQQQQQWHKQHKKQNSFDCGSH
jgi:hypothetical protein